MYGILKVFKEELSEKFVKDITQSMLECFTDRDERIRAAGIEYLQYVCHSMKETVLLNLNNIFEQLVYRSVAESDERISHY